MTWPPITEADIVAALRNGDVVESKRLDFKALVGDSDRARKETAKDLASFAVDGGALLIGVHEDKETRTFHPVPIDLHEVVERIEQIAGNRVDPPLIVRPREIPSGQSGTGYLWIDVPASSDAPHMVDGRYYGRGERTNRILHDAEVVRLHVQRSDTEDEIRHVLDDLQDKDPYPNARPGYRGAASPKSRFGHLYLCAVPRRAPSGLGENLVWDQPRALDGIIHAGSSKPPGLLQNWLNTIGGRSTHSRATSVSVTNLGGDDADKEFRERYGWEVRLDTNSVIGYINTAVTEPSDEDQNPGLVLDGAVLASTWHMFEIIRGVADATGFRGTWDVGIRITNLQGCRSIVFSEHGHFRDKGRDFDEPTYERVVTVTPHELDYGGKGVELFAQPLMRSLSSWERWRQLVPELAPSKAGDTE